MDGIEKLCPGVKKVSTFEILDSGKRKFQWEFFL
jgi:hypothetical protein